MVHSGVPITLVPLDATNTIPITEHFFEAFEKNQKTYEAQYCFQSLKLARDTWFNDQFYSVSSFFILTNLSVTIQSTKALPSIQLCTRESWIDLMVESFPFQTDKGLIITTKRSISLIYLYFAELFHVGLVHGGCSSLDHEK